VDDHLAEFKQATEDVKANFRIAGGVRRAAEIVRETIRFGARGVRAWVAFDEDWAFWQRHNIDLYALLMFLFAALYYLMRAMWRACRRCCCFLLLKRPPAEQEKKTQ